MASKKAASGKPAAKSTAHDTLKARLAKLGLHRPIDVVLHMPLRYEDETRVYPVTGAPVGVPVQVMVDVTDVTVQFRPRRQLVVRTRDASGPLVLRFLNFYGSQTKQFESARDCGTRLRLFGEVRQGFFGDEMVHPRVKPVRDGEPLPDRLTPVYPTTAGLSQAALRKVFREMAPQVDLSALLPADAAPELPALADAVRYLHAPPPGAPEMALQEHTHPAWLRLKLEELVAQQISLKRAYLARRERSAPVLKATGRITHALLASLPFALTGAQQRVMAEVAADLAAPYPMQRLLQGDVGSGKTIVAALAACQAIEAGWQAAFMAPTEILAEQHYLKLRAWLEPMGISVVWLSGSLKAAEKRRRQVAAATLEGAQLVVGTHALIQDAVDFAHLGLAIVDEQHRFGVAQRLALRKKGQSDGRAPHQLMMSATPIPRTLAMTYFADLDVSVLDELPPGRTPVRTRLLSSARRLELIERIAAASGQGRQTYWVCPLIEESESLDLQAALDAYAELSDALPDCAVGLVHGRMKPDEKAATMAAFAAGDLDLLVATTVIEVGVDVPNASLMVIEHAERFGLSQLHQLRGRVGRGAAESVCVLLYAPPLGETARERLKIIYEHTDGFEIARADLKLRGPGEFIGHRQSGTPLLRYADLETDTDLVDRARDLADRMLRDTPVLADRHLERWLGGRDELLKA